MVTRLYLEQGAPEFERVIDFTVVMDPVGKDRPRTVRSGRGVGVVTFTPRRTKAAEQLIKVAAWRAMRGEGRRIDDGRSEYKVTMAFWTAKYGRRPDLDNAAKTVLDAMQGVVYRNDRQVRWLVCGIHRQTKGLDGVTTVYIERVVRTV